MKCKKKCLVEMFALCMRFLFYFYFCFFTGKKTRPCGLGKRNKGLESLDNKVALGKLSRCNELPDKGTEHLGGLGRLHAELGPELHHRQDVPPDVGVGYDVGARSNGVSHLGQRVALKLELPEKGLDARLLVLAQLGVVKRWKTRAKV